MDESRPEKVILIVEDQMLLAMTLKDELERHSYRVLDLAARNQEALGLALAEKPDLALVNIELAYGDDGVALAADLKAMGIPSLFISGQPERARRAKVVGLGSFPKPHSPLELVAAVDYIFRRELSDEPQRRPPGLELFDAAALHGNEKGADVGNQKR